MEPCLCPFLFLFELNVFSLLFPPLRPGLSCRPTFTCVKKLARALWAASNAPFSGAIALGGPGPLFFFSSPRQPTLVHRAVPDVTFSSPLSLLCPLRPTMRYRGFFCCFFVSVWRRSVKKKGPLLFSPSTFGEANEGGPLSSFPPQGDGPHSARSNILSFFCPMRFRDFLFPFFPPPPH